MSHNLGGFLLGRNFNVIDHKIGEEDITIIDHKVTSNDTNFISCSKRVTILQSLVFKGYFVYDKI